MKKRILSFGLVICLLCGLIPQLVPNTFAATYSGECGENLSWIFDTDTGVLCISGKGDMEVWRFPSSAPWYKYRGSVKSVEIASGVTSIGMYAFDGYDSLTFVCIPDSVTYIGSYAFKGCTGLTSVTIPNSVTSTGWSAFEGCTGLIYVTISDGVIDIGDSTFKGCTGLTSVTIPNSVTSIGWSAFEGCTGLTSVTIPDSVTSLGYYAFKGCTGLTSVTISNGVGHISTSAFEGCTGLTSVSIPDGVISISLSAFKGCAGLTSVTIPDSVLNIGDDAFRDCDSLVSVTIPNSVEHIYREAFYGCTGLVKVCILNPSCDIWDGAFTLSLQTSAIYGHPGSTAEKYAKKNYYRFYPLCKCEDYACNYEEEYIEPTCTESGGSYLICSDCGYSITIYVIPATGHSYKITSVIAPSCEWSGLNTYACTSCGATKTESLPANGHSYEITTGVAPSCESSGLNIYTCTSCGATRTESVPATGHSYETIYAVEPSCEWSGLSTYTCTNCGEIKTESLPATGHSYDDGVITTAVTCVTEGVRTYTCGNCGGTKTESIPTLGHSHLLYRNNGTDHSVKCIRCSDSYNEAHSYTDGTCICGAKEPVVDENIKIYHTLDLASDISVTFAVPMSALDDYDSYYLECVLPEYEGNELTGTTIVKIDPVVNGNYYYFTLTGITAVRMGDMVDAVLHMTKGGQEYISKTDSYSVATYAYAMLESTSDTKMRTLCADLLRYGAEAQSFKGYRTDSLVDAAMTEAHRSYLSDTNTLSFTVTDSYLGDLASPTITWVGKTLDLGSKVGVKFVFNARNYSGDIAKLTMKVSYKGSNGETKTVTLTGADVYNASNRYYSFTFYGLLASELRTIVDVAIYNGNTQLSETLRYSVESYASKNTTGALANLCKALFAYSDSAKTYFTK